MKTCPKCRCGLRLEDYEQTNIARCEQCRGVFLPPYKLEIISHRRERSEHELKIEAKTDYRADTLEALRCPGCGRRMVKNPLASRYTTLAVDVCKHCHGLWLDGGELALAQLVFQASTQGRESAEFQRRMATLESDPDRRRQFEDAMAKLPESLPGAREETLAAGLDELLWTLLTDMPWRRDC